MLCTGEELTALIQLDGDVRTDEDACGPTQVCGGAEEVCIHGGENTGEDAVGVERVTMYCIFWRRIHRK